MKNSKPKNSMKKGAHAGEPPRPHIGGMKTTGPMEVHGGILKGRKAKK